MQNKGHPDTILQRHPGCILDLAQPKAIEMGLKKNLKARVFFLYTSMIRDHNNKLPALVQTRDPLCYKYYKKYNCRRNL